VVKTIAETVDLNAGLEMTHSTRKAADYGVQVIHLGLFRFEFSSVVLQIDSMFTSPSFHFIYLPFDSSLALS
jgi:hypothetical protein